MLLLSLSLVLFHLKCVKSSRTALLHSHLVDPPLSLSLWQKLTLTSHAPPSFAKAARLLHSPSSTLSLLYYLPLPPSPPLLAYLSHSAFICCCLLICCLDFSTHPTVLCCYCYLPLSLQRCATSTATSASLSHENVL